MATKGLPEEYSVWRGMINRCYNKNLISYKYYGGRGITVCDGWKNDFLSFYVDMGRRPSGKHTIERVDNDKGYSPENCIWATRDVQARNRRSNINLTCNGVTKCLQDWSDDTGLSASTIRRRLDRMTEKEAIETPSLVKKGRLIKANGKELTIDGWAKELRLDRTTIFKRLNQYPVDEALGAGFRGIKSPGEKAVRQVTKDGDLVAEFKSLSEAGRQTGIDFRLISAVLNGKQKTTKGYKWEYKCKT